MSASTANVAEDVGSSFPHSDSGQVCLPCGAVVSKKITPCDVASLAIRDSTNSTHLTCDHQRRGEDLPDDVPDSVRDRLASYDLVMEVVSGYDGQYYDGDGVLAKKADEKVKLTIDTSYIGHCPEASHPKIHVNSEFDPLQQTEFANPIVKAQLQARPLTTVQGAVPWLYPFWNVFSGGTNLVDIWAESCGVRNSGDVNQELNAAVVIYPSDKYELSFKLPAARRWSGSHKKDWADWTPSGQQLDPQTKNIFTKEKWGAETYSSSSTTTDFGDGLSATDLTIKQQVVPTTTPGLADTGISTVHSGRLLRDDGDLIAANVNELEFERAHKLTPEVSLKKNEHECDISKAFNTLLDLYENIKSAMEALKHLKLTIGWSITFELAICEGSIKAEWGNRLDAKHISDRYTAVEKYYLFDFRLTLFYFKLILKVGVEADAGVFGSMGITLDGSLSLEILLHKVFTNKEEKEEPKPVVAKGKGAISGHVGASCLGYKLVDAKAEVEGGLQFSGTPKISFSESPRVEGKVKRLETTLKYHLIAATGEDPQDVEVPLIEGKELWEGCLPGVTEA
jgi:hypothetical protein